VTTKAQLADALKPLLDRHDDLVLKDRFVLIKPLGYLWRSVMIDTSVDPDAFVPQVAIGLLISSSGYYSLRWVNVCICQTTYRAEEKRATCTSTSRHPRNKCWI
jgi:hypothetical protein